MHFSTLRRSLPATATAVFLAFVSCASAVLPPPPAEGPTLYVSTNGGGTIQQITPGGVVSTYASGLTAPKGLAFGPNGNLFVSQVINGTNTSVVSQVSSTGTVSTYATGLQQPLGIAFNSSGTLFVADYHLNRVATVSPGGGAVSTFSSGLNSPFGVAFDSSGRLYVANRDNDTISRVETNGTFTTFASGFTDPNDLVFDNNGNLYISNFASSTISKVTPDGVVSSFVSSGLSSPVGLAFNPVTGSLFVGNQGTNSIIEISSGGLLSTFATGINGPQYLTFSPSAIPEPSTYAAIAGAAMLGLAIWHRGRRRSPAATPGTAPSA